MGAYLSLPFLALAAMLQSSIVPQIRFWDGGPDLVFLMVLAWAVHAPQDESVVWALVGGILQDMLSVSPLGMSSVGMILVVYVTFSLAQRLHRIGPISLTLLVLGGSLLQQVTLWLLFALLGFTVDLIDDFTYVIVPTVIYNFVLIWPTYWLLRKFQRRIQSVRRSVVMD